MKKLRRAEERGHAHHGWLDTHHTFSFSSYYDPEHMGFRALRVLNDDHVAPGAGFPTHPHRDMEIITYVLEGSLQHRDSMGNGSIIRPGDVQRMSAGTGVTHSEYNPSSSEGLHLLQIWLLPSVTGLAPGYEQKAFPLEERANRLRLVASPEGRDGSVTVHQDVDLHAAVLDTGQTVEHRFVRPHGYLFVAKGRAKINRELELSAGDSLALGNEPALRVEGVDNAELLLFDLA